MEEKDFKYSVNAELSYNTTDGYNVKDLELNGKVKRGGKKDNIRLSQASLMVAILSFNLIEKMLSEFDVNDRDDIESSINDTLGKMHELNYLRKKELSNEAIKKY